MLSCPMMKSHFIPLLVSAIFLLQACEESPQMSSVDPVNWQKRMASQPLPDSLESGITYLSVYSEIYSHNEQSTHDLAVTVSMRNTSITDTIFINRAEYFDTKGRAIRSYFDQSIYLAPMETVEIVIDQADQTGGSGANFLFDWQIPVESSEPLFEAVMISTYGQQGLSFTTQGKRIQ